MDQNKQESIICRANGTDKSSEASLPFLMVRLMRHWSSQLLQPRNRGIDGYGAKFQALGVKLFILEAYPWRVEVEDSGHRFAGSDEFSTTETKLLYEMAVKVLDIGMLEHIFSSQVHYVGASCWTLSALLPDTSAPNTSPHIVPPISNLRQKQQAQKTVRI